MEADERMGDSHSARLTGGRKIEVKIAIIFPKDRSVTIRNHGMTWFGRTAK